MLYFVCVCVNSRLNYVPDIQKGVITFAVPVYSRWLPSIDTAQLLTLFDVMNTEPPHPSQGCLDLEFSAQRMSGLLTFGAGAGMSSVSAETWTALS